MLTNKTAVSRAGETTTKKENIAWANRAKTDRRTNFSSAALFHTNRSCTRNKGMVYVT